MRNRKSITESGVTTGMQQGTHQSLPDWHLRLSVNLSNSLSAFRRVEHLLISVGIVTISTLALVQPLQAAESGSGIESNTAPLEERLKQQEQQILDLQQRLQQVESSAMSGGSKDANEPSEDVPASESSDRRDLGAVREADSAIMTRDELVSDEFPGSWPMFGTDTRMKIGGYVQAEFIYDFDGTKDKTQFLMSTIPVPGMPEYGSDGYFAAFANATRFNFDVRRIKAGAPPLRTFLEGDFYGAGTQFRLRHAYIGVGDYLVGQTWTTLTFLESLPYIIDFAAGDALFGGRSTQIRYTNKINSSWTVAIGAESLEFLGIENPYNLPGQATSQYPLLAARAERRWASGVLFLGTSIAQLHWDGGATGPSDSALQYDFIVAGRQVVGEMTYVTWNVAYGEGSGENIMAFAGSKANAVLGQDGKLTTMPALSFVLGGGHKWNTEWSSNLSVAYGFLDTPETREPLALKRGGIAHVNLIWKPVRQFSTGVEYMWGRQVVQNDAMGKASRIEFMAKYEF